MKKHSPNFFENLKEADTAKNNRAATFFWTVVTVALFLFGLSVTKTKAQCSPYYDLGRKLSPVFYAGAGKVPNFIALEAGAGVNLDVLNLLVTYREWWKEKAEQSFAVKLVADVITKEKYALSFVYSMGTKGFIEYGGMARLTQQTPFFIKATNRTIGFGMWVKL